MVLGVDSLSRRRRLIFACAGAIAVLVGADSALWWLATGRIEQALPGLIAQAQAAGWRVDVQRSERGGWPSAATIRLFSVAAARPPGVRWTADAVRLTWSPFEPGQISVVPEGAQSIQADAGTVLPLHMDRARVTVPLSGGPVPFEAKGVTVGAPGEERATARPALMVASDVRGTVAPLLLSVTASGVRAGPRLQAPFDGPLAFSIAARSSLALPEPVSGDTVRGWRERGGLITLPAMALQWGPLDLTGSGQLRLDEKLQPEGQARLEVRGLAEVLDAAGRGGLIAPGPAQAARAVVTLLSLGARPSGAGAVAGVPAGSAGVPLTVVVQEGSVVVAGFPLARVPVLDWNLP